MNRSQLKAIIKEIVKEVKKEFVPEELTTRAELDKGVMHAVNVEESDSKKICKKCRSAIDPDGFCYNSDCPYYEVEQNTDEEEAESEAGLRRDPFGLDEINTNEQSVSGGAGAYSTPFGFKKKANEVVWDKPADKIYTDIGRWVRDNVKPDKTYKGEPLSNYGFPHKVGDKIEMSRAYLSLLMRSWNDAKKKRNQNLALGKPAGIEEMTATGAVAGYSTPYAFSKKKSGSQRALAATTKMPGWKKVGEAPRV